MASVVDSTAEGVHDTSRRGRWSLKGMARRPEFGAVVATALVYLFFAITTQGAGFVSIDGTAGWLDTAAELGIIAIPVGVLMVGGRIRPLGRLDRRRLCGLSRDRDNDLQRSVLADDRHRAPRRRMRGALQWDHHGPHRPSVIHRVAGGELLRRRRRDRLGALAYEHDKHLRQPAARRAYVVWLGLGTGQRLDPVVDRRYGRRRHRPVAHGVRKLDLCDRRRSGRRTRRRRANQSRQGGAVRCDRRRSRIRRGHPGRGISLRQRDCGPWLRLPIASSSRWSAAFFSAAATARRSGSFSAR